MSIAKPIKPARRRGRTTIKVNAIAYAHLIKGMLEGVYTCQELAEQTGLHYVTVLQYTKEIHSVGAAHIASWEKDARGRDQIKIYKLGPGKDAKRHRRSDRERQAAYRAKKKMREFTALQALWQPLPPTSDESLEVGA
jgi:hypothetical protein